MIQYHTPCQYIKKTSFKKTKVSGPEFLREIRDSRRSLRLFLHILTPIHIYIYTKICLGGAERRRKKLGCRKACEFLITSI